MNRPIEQDAYRYVSLDQLRQLHQGGTDLAAARAAESSDRSVLHFAAFDGKLDRVRFLVEKAGVPITVTMRNRDMPIIEAVSRGMWVLPKCENYLSSCPPWHLLTGFSPSLSRNIGMFLETRPPACCCLSLLSPPASWEWPYAGPISKQSG